jgi:hypothetical protein
VLVLLVSLCFSNLPAQSPVAGARPTVDLKTEHAVPREVNETVQQAVARDYASAWQALETALANNNAAPLNDNFIGFAHDQLLRRIQDQQHSGLKTRIVDLGHKVDAVFYSPEGAAIELRDLATLETEILEADKVIHSERTRVFYYAILTGAEDRWKVRVLESTIGQDDK